MTIINSRYTMLSRYLNAFHLIILVALAGLLSACASHEPVATPRDNAIPVVTHTEEFSKDIDNRREAYDSFILASLAISDGRYEEAQRYLANAIDNDRESFYLNMEMALLLKKRKDFDGALEYGRKCLDINPDNNIQAHLLLGEIYTLTGENVLAIEQYDKALELDPKDERIRLMVTSILIRESQFEKALDYLEKLIAMNPNSSVAYYYRGRVYLEMQNYQEAEKAFNKALEINSNLEPALFDLGALYQITERYTDAVEIFEQLLVMHPDNTLVSENLAMLYLKLGLKKEAESQIERLKERSIAGGFGRETLGRMYLKQGQLDEAIKELDLIVTAWPDDDKSRFYLATAYEKKGDFEKAFEHFIKIKPESNHFVSAQMHGAYILDSQEKHDEAMAMLEKALLAGKGETDLRLFMGSLYEAREEYEKAIEVTKEGLKKDENNIELIFRLGVLFDKTDDKASCLAQMKRVLEINPDHVDSLNYIGYTYAEQGINLDEALTLIQKAMRLKPGRGYIIDSLGWVYYQKGMYDEAIHYLEKSAQLTPDDPTINEHLGNAYQKKNMNKKALECYRKALTLNPSDKEALKEKVSEVERLIKEGE